MFNILLSGCTEGLIWGLLALGFYIAFRILDFADMTCEGSITLGASVAALCIWSGVSSFLAMILAFLSGCIAGVVTGFLHTKLKIAPILSGILTMAALFSINIHIMSAATGSEGTANLGLLTYSDSTVYSILKELLGLKKTETALVFGIVVAFAVIGLLYWFFGTALGCSIRATGNNEKMCRAQGINTDSTKIVGLAIANGLIALSGSMLCQFQGYSDVKMGVGSIVIALASIIIGEAIFARAKNFFVKLLGIIVGSVIYRIIFALVIYSGIPSEDLKLISAAVVVLALAITTYKSKISGAVSKLFSNFKKKGEKDNAK